ncbi:hypothetical protein [Pseudomonas sp. S1(2024)]|uniref:DUF7281 domain-containing protein n=1 Tax=Pseudomonas sp. S1(2024) TaxID=3390191 RepID=UPI00397915FB
MQTLGIIKRLLAIYQSVESDYRSTKQLDAFCAEYGIGQRVGAKWRFTQADKQAIAVVIRNVGKVDPDTPTNAWEGSSRTEALSKGGNEKFTGKRLRHDRVAVKSLPGRPLLVGPTPIELPEGACLDLDRHWVVKHCGHDSVLLVENWENFELSHQTPILTNITGNPLVVFRGAPGSYRTQSAQRLLTALELPVVAFTDYDPEGLAIAASLPFFSRYLAPSDALLTKLMDEVSTERRYQNQLVGKLAMLEKLSDPDLVRVYRIIRTAGKALPQEKLIGLTAFSSSE